MSRTSQENVDIARRAWEAAIRQPPDWETLGALYDQDHVLESEWGAIEAKEYRGVEGYLHFRADMDEAFSDWRHEFIDVTDAGSDQVVVGLRLVATARLSQSPVEQPFAVLMTVRDGRIVRTSTFGDAQAAHAASSS